MQKFANDIDAKNFHISIRMYISRQKTCRLDSYKLLLTIELPTNQSNKLYSEVRTQANLRIYIYVCMSVCLHVFAHSNIIVHDGNQIQIRATDSNAQHATDANAIQMEAWRIHINCSTSNCRMNVCVCACWWLASNA